jgi:hypothetical protein
MDWDTTNRARIANRAMNPILAAVEVTFELFRNVLIVRGKPPSPFSMVFIKSFERRSAATVPILNL